MRALGSGWRRGILEAGIALASVAIVSLILDLVDADQTVAALTLVVLAVLLTFAGTTAMIVGILASFASLNYFFTPPDGFGIDNADDIVALMALGITTGVLGTTIAQVNRLRQRAELREAEIRSRLELSNRLAAGDDPDRVLRDAEDVLTTIFGLDRCDLTRTGDGALDVSIAEGSRPLITADRSEIAAFVMGIGTALERVELADAVRAAQVEATVEQSRASFLAAMTHNLRTPLATIKAAVTSLRVSGSNLDSTASRELLDTAAAESDRLEQLVTKVLDLSRIRAGAIVSQPEAIELAEATQGAVQRLRVLAAERDIALDAPGGLPLVRADPALLDVALVNVLENALRYAPGSAIEVRGRTNGSEVHIQVVDHGPGIADDDRDRVFDEFVRLPSSAPGTGIGLTIARAFVTAQGGTIAIEETAGGGVTVTLALPVEKGIPR